MIALRITVRCDECFEQLVYETKNRGGLSLTDALRAAERIGWQASMKVARCPLHRRKARWAHAFVPGGWTGREPDICSVKRSDLPYAAACGKTPEHRVHAI